MRPDDISEGFGPVGTNGPSLIERLRTPLSMDLFASKDHMITALLGEREEAAAALEAFRDGTTSPVTSPVRILIDAIESEIRQLEGTAAWKSQAARIASLRAAIDAAREARNE